MSNTINVFVDDISKIDKKSILPEFGDYIKKSICVDVNTLRDNINQSLESIFEVISNVVVESQKYEVSEITFSLNISSTGEVSLVSLAKGTIGGQTGLSFKITKKHDDEV